MRDYLTGSPGSAVIGAPRPEGEPLDLFFSHVAGDFGTGCWLWIAGTDGKGYGTFWDEGPVKVHRWAWEHVAGLELLPDMQVDHVCLNTMCVRPGHLQQVTGQVNGRLIKARRVAPVPDGMEAAPPLLHQTMQEVIIGGQYGMPVALHQSAAERRAEVIESINLENGWTPY